jgi:aconitate hydratase
VRCCCCCCCCFLLQGKRKDGSTYEFKVNQTFNENQISWFKAGSALNAMAAAFAAKK